MNSSRRRLRRAMLALAGGGLTAAGLSGPLSGGALAATAQAATAGAPAGTGGATEDTVTSSSASTPVPSGSAQGSGGGETTTTTTSASTPAAPINTASTSTATTTPAPTPTPAAGAPASSAPSAPAGPSPASAPTVVVQRTQPARPKRRGSKAGGARGGSSAQGQQGTGGQQSADGVTTGKSTGANSPATAPPGTPNGVAQPPQVVAAQAGTLAALLGQSTVSAQALEFYRVPLFLLPIYQAAGIQYGVPWQILAAINEVETDYGNDLSVSTAGAVGWMQFMPETWLQYGVDALGAGYADPYNPVDAIFAAARYLHAAGASSNLHTAILAYNHSEAYVESVLLRAKLIASYPQSVIATLTGLTEGRLPVAGARIVQDPAGVAPALSPSSATAGAVAVEGAAAGASFGTTGSAPGASDVTAGTASGTGWQASGTGSQAAGAGSQGSTSAAPTPGSADAPTPAAAASGLNLPASPAASAQGSGATGSGKSRKPQEELHFVDLLGTPKEAVTAVEDGRIVKLGRSHRLGNYLALQDIYGDIFTYAGLGSIAPRYHVADLAVPTDPGHSAANAGQKKSAAQVPDSARGATGVVATPAVPLPLAAAAAKTSAHTPKPVLPASAGSQPPLTLHVKALHTRPAEPEAEEQPTATGSGAVPAGMGRVRLYAHPGNPVARVAAVRAAQNSAKNARGPWLPLRVGSVVSQGTVLGHLKGLPGQGAAALNVPLGSQAVGSLGAAGAARTVRLRFAIRPAGDSTTVNAQPILENWRQLAVALHPKGAKGTLDLLDATAAQVFLMSQSELERTVLSDPGVDLGGCGRQDVASGAVDGRVLAMLELLSRSGLRPTVSAMRCTDSRLAAASRLDAAHQLGTAVDISAINGIPIAGHQGTGSITDLTIRTLLTLQGRFQPRQILSLMKYPDAHNTIADATQWSHIHIDFRPLSGALALNPAASATVAHSAGAAGRPAPAPQAVTPELSPTQWDALIARIGALQEPTVSAKPSGSAIRDPQAAAGNRGLGSDALPFGSGPAE